MSDTFRCVIIGPIGCNTDEQDLEMALVTEGYWNTEVKSIMKKQGKFKAVFMSVGLEIGKLWQYANY